MGVRGELFSTKVALQNRTYFFNVKENRLGDLYLNIVESKNRETGGFDRQSVILFADDLKEFLTGFDESLRVMEKAVREKRRGEKPRIRLENPKPGNRPEGSRSRNKMEGLKPGDRRRSGDKPPAPEHQRTSRPFTKRTRSEGNKPPEKPRRRVVRRKD